MKQLTVEGLRRLFGLSLGRMERGEKKAVVAVEVEVVKGEALAG